jgi:hypothetical protein
VVFRVVEYGEVVSEEPTLLPSTLNWTLDTLTLSVAFAETATLLPEMVAPAAGAVIETVGTTLSAVTLTAELVKVLPAASRATAVKL